jgi:hypothetical protein
MKEKQVYQHVRVRGDWCVVTGMMMIVWCLAGCTAKQVALKDFERIRGVDYLIINNKLLIEINKKK